MPDLQILDLSENRLKLLPSSIGYLSSLRTFLVHGNELDSSFDHLVNPLMKSYEKMLPAGKIHNDKKSAGKVISSRHPGQAYLLRIQGHLADQFDLEIARENDPDDLFDHGMDIFPLQDAMRDAPLILIQPTIHLEPAPKRARIIAEIVETEITYVNQLMALEEIYQLPLQRNRILSSADLEIIFSNISSVLTVHERY